MPQMARPLYLARQIRTIEQHHGAAGPSLMERAGLCAAELARVLLPENAHSVLVLAGPGNNGGDALVAAQHLKSWWHQVTVVFTGSREQLPPDAGAALEAWLACGGELATEIPTNRHYGLIVDGLFGIGITRDLDARHQALVQTANAFAAPKLALDVPSGLCADSGRIFGAALRADHTITFLGLKPGLYTLDGPDYAGQVHLADLGVDAPNLCPPDGWLLESPPTLPPARRRNSHKGSYGSVGVLGGNTSMVGAALLTARAALLSGAGRVYAGLLAEDAPAVDSAQPELMLRSTEALFKLEHLTTLVAGPGMGHNGTAETALSHALARPEPLLLDADALQILASRPSLRKTLAKRLAGSTVLTPHPGEAAALLSCSAAEVQADRIRSALLLAEKFHGIAVLKGVGSVIAFPDGRWFINASGNPGLASAGMGDVLAGIIGSLAAQGMSIADATLLGVHLHGAAADALVADGMGPVGLTASEVALAARDMLNQWIAEG